jgi:hypothetical protein
MRCSHRVATWRLAAAIGIAGTMLTGGALDSVAHISAAAMSPTPAVGLEAIRVTLTSADVPSPQRPIPSPLSIIIGDPGGDGPGPK